MRTALILSALLLAACEDEAARAARQEKERTYALVEQCIRMRGNPILGDDGLFRTCDFARDWHVNWHYKGPRRD